MSVGCSMEGEDNRLEKKKPEKVEATSTQKNGMLLFSISYQLD